MAHEPILLHLRVTEGKIRTAAWSDWKDATQMVTPTHEYTNRSQMKNDSGWTVGMLRRCSERKMYAMERKESGLHKFLLVQGCLAAAEKQSGSVPLDTFGVPLTTTISQPIYKSNTIYCIESEARPKKLRRPSIQSRPKPVIGNELHRTESFVEDRDCTIGRCQSRLDSRPPKKRRLKRLLGDAGCFAAVSAKTAAGHTLCTL